MFKYVLLMIILSSFVLEVQAYETCREKILNNFSVDSKAFIINDISEVINLNAPVSGNQAEKLIVHLIQSIDCLVEENDISHLELKGSCLNIEPGNELSRACYIHSRIGYFNISFSMMDEAHIIFSRFD
jgi:hypothetical protein